MQSLTGRGTPILFAGTTINGVAPTVSFTPKNIVSGSGWISAAYDRGTAAMPERYILRGHTKTKTVGPTAGATVTMYLADGDTFNTAGGFTGGTAALVDSKRRNLTPVGVISSDAAAASTGPYDSPGYLVSIVDRYVRVAFWNEMGFDLTNFDTDHWITLTPYWWDTN